MTCELGREFVNTQREQQLQEETKTRLETQYKLLYRQLDETAIFPGDKREYEEMMGYTVEIIVLPKKDKGIRLFANKEHSASRASFLGIDENCLMALSGIEAIIHARPRAGPDPSIYGSQWYGLPVRRKK
jgi:hypothetical protein